MDKLNQTQIQAVLKDVRASYRLLALYQKRLLDIVKYIANAYNLNFKSGWSKFSAPAQHGNRASIDKWSWDWLTMYLYEFNLGAVSVKDDEYYFKILHQADTGYFDAHENENISKLNIDQFSESSQAKTRLIFVLSKNENGCPLQHILNEHLTASHHDTLLKENWLAVPYNLDRFLNQASTDLVLNEFNAICKETFGIDLFGV